MEEQGTGPLPPVYVGGSKRVDGKRLGAPVSSGKEKAKLGTAVPSRPQQAKKVPGPSRVGGNGGAGMRANHTAVDAYDKEKTKLISQFQKKRTELQSRGVFDSHVNTIRAENMLMTALGKIRMTTLCKAGSKDIQGTFDRKGVAPAHSGQPAHRDSLTQPAPVEQEDTEKPAVEYSASKQNPDSMAGRIQRELTTRHTERVKQLEQDEVTKRQHQEQPRAKKNDALLAEEATNTLTQMLSSHTASTREGSFMVQMRSIAAKEVDPAQGKGRGHGTEGGDRRGHDLEAALRDSHDVDFSAAEWLQKQWEHLQYTPVEARLQQRAKQADDLTRPGDVVARYTEPRRWMTTANRGNHHEGHGAAEGIAEGDLPAGEEGPASDTHRLVRRESDLAPAAVNGGRQLWERNAAVLSVEDMLHMPSLAEVVDAELVKNATAGAEKMGKAANAPPPMPHPRHMVYSPTFKGNTRLREVFRSHNQAELVRQRRVVHSSVKHHEPTAGGALLEVQSHDSDNPVDLDQDRAPNVPSSGQQTVQETMSLLEGVITFMCKEFNLRRSGRGNPMSTVKIVRNLLIQCLRTLIPPLGCCVEGGQDGETQWSGVASGGAQGKRSFADNGRSSPLQLPEAGGQVEHRVWLLRTWAKGAEVLLTWDLSLDEPFSAASEVHFELFVRYYTGLRRKIRYRMHRLLVRWKTAGSDPQPLPDPSDPRFAEGVGGEAVSPPGEGVHPTGSSGVYQEDAHTENQFASPYCTATSQPTTSAEAKQQAELAEKKAEIACALGKVAVDGSNPQMANAVRQFMAKLGFVPSGPSGGGRLPDSSVSRLKSKILASTIHEHTARTRVTPAPEMESGSPVPCNLYFGTVLSNTTRVYIVTTTTRAHSCKNPTSVVDDASERARNVKSPYVAGTVLVCIAEEGDWVQMDNGYYVPLADVTRSDDTTGQVLQHSADNHTMRGIVGAKEARQRQRAQLLNCVLSVVTQYVRITSRHFQERFVACVREEAVRPVVPEEESRLDRLLCYDSDGSEDDLHKLEEAEAKAKAAQVEAETHKVAKDMLIQKYGSQYKTPARLQRQQLIDNPDMWAGALDPATRAAVNYSTALTKENLPDEPKQQTAPGSDAGSDAEVPSLASSVSEGDGHVEDPGTSESALVSKYMTELDRVLQAFKWGFQRRHDVSKLWSGLPGKELALKSRLWRRALSIYQSRQIALSNLLKKLEGDPSLMAAPHIVTDLCKKVASLGQRLETKAQKVEDLTGDKVSIDGFSIPELLERDHASLQAAITKAKNVPAAQVMASYLKGEQTYTSESFSHETMRN